MLNWLLPYGQFLSGTEDKCDPEIEDCPVRAEQHEYESYETYTLSLGIILSILGIAPLFLFLYPVWYGLSAAQQTMILDKHIIYFTAWLFLAVTHTIIFLPFAIIWLILFFFTSAPYEGGLLSFYEFWLGGLIAPSILFIMAGTWLFFLTDVILEYGSDDESYKVIEPILVLVIYGLYAPLTIILTIDYHERAILYFNAEQRQLYEQDRAAEKQAAAEGQDDILPENVAL